MRKSNLVIITLLLSTSLYAQQTYFHELKGIEDSTNTTHLFYRIYNSDTDEIYTNHIYHFNTETEADSVLLIAESLEPDDSLYIDSAYPYVDISKYLFHNNDPSLPYFSRYYKFDPCCDSFYRISIYDWNRDIVYTAGGGPFTQFTLGDNQNNQLIISGWASIIFRENITPGETRADILYSFSQDTATTLEGYAIGQNPYTNELILINDEEHKILDSAFNVIDSIQTSGIGSGAVELTPMTTDTFFDADSSTFYTKSYGHPRKNDKILYSSIWRFKKADTSGYNLTTLNPAEEFAFTIDKDHPGHVYISRENSLLFSFDYGDNFELIENLDDEITGLYKKPDSNLLFVLTTQFLYSYNLSSEEIIVLKVIPTSTEEILPDIPTQITLHQNYPNPFNPSTVINYSIPESSHIRLVIYDFLGREVQVLVDEFRNAGSHSETFTVYDIASGVYYYELTAPDIGERLIKRMTLIR